MAAARRMTFALLGFCLLVLAQALPAVAVQPDEVLADTALEARARALSRELRCMVCQNQSIDDSDAPLARDLRLLVRERLKAGDTDRGVIDFLVARYGDFVLLRPRFSWQTAALWSAPFLVLVLGAGAIWLGARRRSAAETSTANLAPDEERRLRDITH
jgi:cytochrome c-type biogenesis protein CcmH